MTIHDLRHTFASILIAAGHHVKYIQGQMGHSSAQITLDVCSHLMPDVHNDAAKTTGAFLQKALSRPVMDPEQKKEVASDSQPLDLLGSGG